MSVTVTPVSRAVDPVSTKHTHTVIFLHDGIDTFPNKVLGNRSSNGKTLPEAFPSHKWVFLSSFVSIENNEEGKENMKPWYIRFERADSTYGGLRESIDTIKTAITGELAYLTTENVILCGVGRGCAAASRALLNGAFTIRGFIGFGGWLGYLDDLGSNLSNGLLNEKPARPGALVNTSSLKTPKSPQSHKDSSTTGSNPQFGDNGEQLPLRGLTILIGQSRGDKNVSRLSGQTLYTALIKKGASGNRREYDHNLSSVMSREGIDDMIDFMNVNFPADSKWCCIV
ncbi:hypothetical protein ONS95_000864 [Cadophora gregata]|uniref:uncharacterized protein n=1 Tax=Cadophora gregata TaxID=51156 RepID=UPI0026DBACC3|nr:uncharacterized protein ONS95_000864 [Cadophora gregata]KAK0128920.1 hypothetical protein ONS95_000864 [Cadophora gregata]